MSDEGDVEAVIAAERALRNAQATVYDAHRARHAYARSVEDEVVLHALDPRPALTVLDAGCGTGLHLGALLERSARVIGVDHSSRSLDVARARLSAADLGRTRLVTADLRALPLEDASVDRVMSVGVIQHVPTPAARGQVMRELLRVLRPGGLAVVLAYRWLGHVRRHKEGDWGDGLYRYSFTSREFRALFAAAGFEDVAVGGAVIAPALAERLRISTGTQRRLAFTPIGRHTAHYVVGRGRAPG